MLMMLEIRGCSIAPVPEAVVVDLTGISEVVASWQLSLGYTVQTAPDQ
jgi:hypothetical protein